MDQVLMVVAVALVAVSARERNRNDKSMKQMHEKSGQEVPISPPPSLVPTSAFRHLSFRLRIFLILIPFLLLLLYPSFFLLFDSCLFSISRLAPLHHHLHCEDHQFD